MIVSAGGRGTANEYGNGNDKDQMPPVTGTAGCNHTLGALVNTDQRSKFLPSESFPDTYFYLQYRNNSHAWLDTKETFHHALLARGIACANDCMRSDVARVSGHGQQNCPFPVTVVAWDGAPLSTGSSQQRGRVGLSHSHSPSLQTAFVTGALHEAILAFSSLIVKLPSCACTLRVGVYRERGVFI